MTSVNQAGWEWGYSGNGVPQPVQGVLTAHPGKAALLTGTTVLLSLIGGNYCSMIKMFLKASKEKTFCLLLVTLR